VTSAQWQDALSTFPFPARPKNMASEEAEASAQLGQEEVDPQFAPVHLLTDKDRVEVTTGEESELELFKSEAASCHFHCKLTRAGSVGTDCCQLGPSLMRQGQALQAVSLRSVGQRMEGARYGRPQDPA
jgi:hypothetical protein